MSRIVQEKFQLNYPQSDSDDASAEGGHWVTDQQARAKKKQPGREGLPGGDYRSRYMDNNVFFNTLPPGMDIEDQEVADIRKMEVVDSAGYNQVSEEIQHLGAPTALANGFARLKMLSTDDMYTREHNDAFYDVVEEDGVEGYVERNNMLDRM